LTECIRLLEEGKSTQCKYYNGLIKEIVGLHLRQNRLDLAINFLNENRFISSENVETRLIVHLELSKIYTKKKDPKNAMKHCIKGAYVADMKKNEQASMVFENFGGLMKMIGNTRIALQLFQTSLDKSLEKQNPIKEKFMTLLSQEESMKLTNTASYDCV